MKANGDKRDGGSYKSGAQNVLSADEPSVGRVADSDDGSGGVAATLDLLELYPLQARTRYDPVLVEVVVNGKEVRMELDTGAAVSVMSSNVYERISRVGQDKLQKSKVTLKTYTGELVQPEGVGWVDVVYKQQRCRLPVTVVKGNVPMLFGRDWLAKLKLDWGELFPAVAVNALQPNSRVEALAAEFPEVFSDKLGCLKDFKVHIPVPEGVQPRFFKPRPVRHALRGRVEEELDKLEEQGVWRKVQYARWVAPSVPVPRDPKKPAGW